MGSEVFPANLGVYGIEAWVSESEIAFWTQFLTKSSSKVIRITVITRSRRSEIQGKMRKDGKYLDN